MMKKRKNKLEDPNHQTLIILLLFTFCFLVVIYGVSDLYNIVRNCIIAILVLYLGWKGMSSGNVDPPRKDNDLEDKDDE